MGAGKGKVFLFFEIAKNLMLITPFPFPSPNVETASFGGFLKANAYKFLNGREGTTTSRFVSLSFCPLVEGTSFFFLFFSFSFLFIFFSFHFLFFSFSFPFGGSGVSPVSLPHKLPSSSKKMINNWLF